MKKTILVACAMLLAAPLPLAAQTTTDVNGQPTGEGNPDDITCRTPQIIPGTRKRGPKVCKTNVVWAQYREDGMTVSEDGTRDMPLPKGKNCTSGGTSGVGGTSSARGMAANITCE
jgi:hypothetical protein